VAHYIAWHLIRNPRLNVVYASYSQFRANSVSRLIRSLVDRFTPLPTGHAPYPNGAPGRAVAC